MKIIYATRKATTAKGHGQSPESESTLKLVHFTEFEALVQKVSTISHKLNSLVSWINTKYGNENTFPSDLKSAFSFTIHPEESSEPISLNHNNNNKHRNTALLGQRQGQAQRLQTKTVPSTPTPQNQSIILPPIPINTNLNHIHNHADTTDTDVETFIYEHDPLDLEEPEESADNYQQVHEYEIKPNFTPIHFHENSNSFQFQDNDEISDNQLLEQFHIKPCIVLAVKFNVASQAIAQPEPDREPEIDSVRVHGKSRKKSRHIQYDRDVDFPLISHGHVHGNSYSPMNYEYDISPMPSAQEIQEIDTPSKLYKCQACPKYFRSLQLKTQHEEIHSSARPFPCDLCGLRFKDRGHLTFHLRTHTTEKKYKCDVGDCIKTFTCARYLRDHKKGVHGGAYTKIRRFKCTDCGISFKHRSWLTRHRYQHMAEKPITCDTCGQGFSLPKYLRKHQEEWGCGVQTVNLYDEMGESVGVEDSQPPELSPQNY